MEKKKKGGKRGEGQCNRKEEEGSRREKSNIFFSPGNLLALRGGKRGIKERASGKKRKKRTNKKNLSSRNR